MSTNRGFSLVELLVTVALFSIVGIAGFILFTTGQSIWSVTDAKIQLQQNIRKTLTRISLELQESGLDSTPPGTFRVTVLDNAGVNGSDILRFSVPLCACGRSVIDQNGEAQSWGAPLTWGQAGCNANYPINQNGKVTICHLPPGNPTNPQTIEVSVNAVKAHLAHSDWIGDCNSCNPTTYTNRTVEYLMDNSGNLLRRVLDTNNNLISSVSFAQNFTGFQVSLSPALNPPTYPTTATVSVQLVKNAVPVRIVTVTGDIKVSLRNK